MHDCTVEKMSEGLLFLALTIIMLWKVFVFLFFFPFEKAVLLFKFYVRQWVSSCPNVTFTIQNHPRVQFKLRWRAVKYYNAKVYLIFHTLTKVL